MHTEQQQGKMTQSVKQILAQGIPQGKDCGYPEFKVLCLQSS